jgi:hypothetical protein
MGQIEGLLATVEFDEWFPGGLTRGAGQRRAEPRNGASSVVK